MRKPTRGEIIASVSGLFLGAGGLLLAQSTQTPPTTVSEGLEKGAVVLKRFCFNEDDALVTQQLETLDAYKARGLPIESKRGKGGGLITFTYPAQIDDDFLTNLADLIDEFRNMGREGEAKIKETDCNLLKARQIDGIVMQGVNMYLMFASMAVRSDPTRFSVEKVRRLFPDYDPKKIPAQPKGSQRRDGEIFIPSIPPVADPESSVPIPETFS